jgi:zona occludens toxin
MIIFHGGLPGSGKSYEAMKERIVPALAQGREVVAYVEGLDFDKIAELAGVTPERCRELLHPLTREQVQTVHVDPNSGKVVKVDDHLPGLARDNALIVVDEAQNFWGNRAKLSAELVQFITEHRHRGVDIVLMGQDLRDVHATWRRRVELNLAFLKLNGIKLPKLLQVLTFNKIGTENGYSVTTYRHLGADNFQRLGLSMRNYDTRFFGTYKSHVTDDTNTEVYTDKRAQVWNHPMLKWGMPAMGVALVLGVAGVWKFFHPAPAKLPAAEVAASGPALGHPVAVAARQAVPASASELQKPDTRRPIERRMADLQGKARIRLAGLISSSDHISGVVEWVQGGNVVIERLSLDTLRALGVGVLVTEDVVQLYVGEYRELATSWPMEDLGRMSESRQASVRGPVQVASSGRQVAPEVAAVARPSMSLDLPGPITVDPDAGSLPRRVRRVAQ